MKSLLPRRHSFLSRLNAASSVQCKHSYDASYTRGLQYITVHVYWAYLRMRISVHGPGFEVTRH